jgi:hypothetical protein
MDEFRKDLGTLYKFGKSSILYGIIMFIIFLIMLPGFLLILGLSMLNSIVDYINKH